MDEKVRFVSRHLEGESISELCREFGISRVTGHKLVDRYKQHGIEALSDRTRRPYRMANQLPFQVGACPRFCVNGLMAGSCRSSQRKRNDRKQRIDRPPAGGLQKA